MTICEPPPFAACARMTRGLPMRRGALPLGNPVRSMPQDTDTTKGVDE